jgi:succinate dehydrogenase / fumarate reductase cytochrome b subunit
MHPSAGSPDARPRFLNLAQIRLPITGVASIAHRVSGLALVLLTPALIYVLDLSLSNPGALRSLGDALSGSPLRFLAVPVGWALAHHLFAGLRYLALDAGLGETREAARRSARVSLALGVLAAALAGMVVA